MWPEASAATTAASPSDNSPAAGSAGSSRHSTRRRRSVGQDSGASGAQPCRLDTKRIHGAESECNTAQFSRGGGAAARPRKDCGIAVVPGEYADATCTLTADSMRTHLEVLDKQSERAGELGAQLLNACAGDIFPCDALATSVLARTLNQVRGFKLLMEAGSFNCAAPLLRLQLDSLLRFHGVVTCTDPHMVALKVCHGTPLRKIKHTNGDKMTDQHLQSMLAKVHPWIPGIYQLSSGYVHLSEQHFLHLLMQSSKGEDGTRHFKVSDDDDYLPAQHKVELVQTFSRVTAAVLERVEHWIAHRHDVTDPDRLKAQLAVM